MEQGEIQIREARVEEIIDLRWRTLRTGLPREMASFPGDHEPTTHHFAAIDGNDIIGCASFMQSPWENKPAWQLRGMAVSEGLRGAGIGTRMLEYAEQILACEGFSRQLWCNARTPAAKFYERLGWQKCGEVFLIEHAGPHFKMTKMLHA